LDSTKLDLEREISEKQEELIIVK